MDAFSIGFQGACGVMSAVFLVSIPFGIFLSVLEWLQHRRDEKSAQYRLRRVRERMDESAGEFRDYLYGIRTRPDDADRVLKLLAALQLQLDHDEPETVPHTVLSPRQSGFTLIELLIVIAIIGIFAALAIPAWKDYRCDKNPACVAAKYPTEEQLRQARIERRERETPVVCLGGYRWIDNGGDLVQIMGDDGKPERCTSRISTTTDGASMP